MSTLTSDDCSSVGRRSLKKIKESLRRDPHKIQPMIIKAISNHDDELALCLLYWCPLDQRLSFQCLIATANREKRKTLEDFLWIRSKNVGTKIFRNDCAWALHVMRKGKVLDLKYTGSYDEKYGDDRLEVEKIEKYLDIY